MFAKYVSTNLATQAQVISDLALLASGSPLSALSSGCDKVNSTLLSTLDAGWTLIDSAGPGMVLSAPDANGLTNKIVRLYAQSAGLIDLMGYLTWNPTTHVGTAPTVAAVANLNYGVNSINTFWVFATARSLIISTPSYISAAIEFSREANYLIGNANYPCFLISSLAGLVGSPVASTVTIGKIKNMQTGADLLSSSANSMTGTLVTRNPAGASVANTGPSTSLLDQAGAPFNQVLPMWVMTTYMAPANSQALIGKLYDVQETTRNIAGWADTFNDGTDNFMCFPAATSSILLKMA